MKCANVLKKVMQSYSHAVITTSKRSNLNNRE
jgi:hypothetical protein